MSAEPVVHTVRVTHGEVFIGEVGWEAGSGGGGGKAGADGEGEGGIDGGEVVVDVVGGEVG